MKSTVKTVKGRGRPKGSKNKVVKISDTDLSEKWAKYVKDFNEWMEDVESDQFARFEKTIEQLEKNVEQLEKDLERKDHTLEIMRDEIRELEKYLADQKEKNAFLELDVSHLKDIIKRLVEHL